MVKKHNGVQVDKELNGTNYLCITYAPSKPAEIDPILYVSKALNKETGSIAVLSHGEKDNHAIQSVYKKLMRGRL